MDTQSREGLSNGIDIKYDDIEKIFEEKILSLLPYKAKNGIVITNAELDSTKRLVIFYFNPGRPESFGLQFIWTPIWVKLDG